MIVINTGVQRPPMLPLSGPGICPLAFSKGSLLALTFHPPRPEVRGGFLLYYVNEPSTCMFNTLWCLQKRKVTYKPTFPIHTIAWRVCFVVSSLLCRSPFEAETLRSEPGRSSGVKPEKSRSTCYLERKTIMMHKARTKEMIQGSSKEIIL
jgi:hypothetical protein